MPRLLAPTWDKTIVACTLYMPQERHDSEISGVDPAPEYGSFKGRYQECACMPFGQVRCFELDEAASACLQSICVSGESGIRREASVAGGGLYFESPLDHFALAATGMLWPRLLSHTLHHKAEACEDAVRGDVDCLRGLLVSIVGEVFITTRQMLLGARPRPGSDLALNPGTQL